MSDDSAPADTEGEFVPDYSPFTAEDRERMGPIFNGPISESLLRDMAPYLLGAGGLGGVSSVVKTALEQRGLTMRERIRQDGKTERTRLGQADPDHDDPAE